jgi:tetratricopeptide (TPR) repeat protein
MRRNNKEMPARPRQHQLESESRAALRSRIPPEWVFRDKTDDYGIDAEIEIFDSAGKATGLVFHVQLKATDEPDIKKALRIHFEVSKFHYYHALDLPVLVILYHSPSRQLYCRWFHSFDPYYSRSSKSRLTFRISEADQWTSSTPTEIIMTIRAFREIRSAVLTFPIRFKLLLDERQVHGISSYEIIFSIRRACERCRSIIDIVPDDSSDKSFPYKISINNNKVEITLAGYHGFTLHTKAGYLGTKTTQEFVPDIMICVALALSAWGHYVGAASIISEFVHSSKLAKIDHFAFPIVICLARANRLQLSLEIAEIFFKNETSLGVAQTYLIPFLTSRKSIPPSVLEFGIQMISRIAEEVEKRGERTAASTLNYNIANIQRSLCRFPEAVARYKRAARLNREYINRAYFWSEMGGILFLRRHYSIATSFYKRSLDLAFDKGIQPLYADALMFSGRYKEAQGVFSDYLRDSKFPENPEWCLKYCVLCWLQQQLEVEAQRRRESLLLATFCPAAMSDQEIEKTCKLILEEDALSSLAWFNLGVVKNKAGDFQIAMMSFLIAALIRQGDYESWRNAMRTSLYIGKFCIFLNALHAAYKANGNDFLEYLIRQFPDKDDKMAILLMQATASLPKGQYGTVLRVHQAGAGWDEVVIKDGQAVRKDNK